MREIQQASSVSGRTAPAFFSHLFSSVFFAGLITTFWFFSPATSTQAGTAVAWGWYAYGLTNVPAGLSDVVAISASDNHSLALLSDGRTVGWGHDYYGVPIVPPAPPEVTNVVSIACGGRFNLALQSNGIVAAWGDGQLGETNVPPGLTNAKAVAAGDGHSLVVLEDGTLRSWGSVNASSLTRIPAGVSNVVSVAAGGLHSVALLSDGRIVAWGDNSQGQTQVPAGLTNVIAIAANMYQNFALHTDGSVAAWGNTAGGSGFVPATVPVGFSELIAVAAGKYHALGLQSNRTVVPWGYDSGLGATNVPAGLSNVVALAAGWNHSVALVSTDVLHLANRLPNVSIHAGGTLHLQISPVGSGTLRYQWRHAGTNLPGATNSFLIRPNMQPALAGLYSVTVSNAAGMITDDAQVSVIPAWIMEHPQSQIRYVSGTTTFAVSALGNGLTYQWRFNGTNISGRTQTSLVLTNLELSDSGLYSVLVSNSLGSATSADARLDVVHVAAWGNNEDGQANLHPGLTNIADLSAGVYHNLALRQDGTVFAWGKNDGGSTNVPPGLSNVVGIAAGGYHNLALRSNGTVTAWGYTGPYQLNVPPGLSNVLAVAAGGERSLALGADGKVEQWGSVAWGIGLPESLSNVVAIAASWNHNLALRADGKVVGWGDDFYGQSTAPNELSNAVAVAAGGGFSLALRADGTVFAWGRHFEGQTNVPPGLSNVIAIAVGANQSLALRDDGAVVAWGSTNFAWGGMNYSLTPPADLASVVGVASGAQHNLALIGNGPPWLPPLPDRTVTAGATVYFRVPATGQRPLRFQWRFNGTNIPAATNALLALANVQPSQAGLYSVVATNALGSVTSREAQLNVAPLFITADLTNQVRYAGSTFTLSVGAEGSGPLSYQWRFNGSSLADATNAVLELNNAQPEQAGFYSVVISNSYGAVTSAPMRLELSWVAMWGRYSEGSLPLPALFTNVVALAEGAAHTLALRPDGTVLAWGFNNFGQTNVPAGLSDVAAISAGTYFSVALRSNGTMTAWGRSDLGSLNVPAGLSGVIAFSAGGGHTLALRSNGTVTAWGYNYGGSTNVPPGLTNVVAVAGGGSHSLALRADGTVVAWGDNTYYGQATVPPGLSNVVAVSAGYYHSLALRADGTVAAWGANYYGQINLPASLTNVVAIDAAGYHSVALRADGAVICWGESDLGQLAVPAGLTNVVGIAGGGPGSLALLGAGTPFVRTRVANRTILAGRDTWLYAEASGAKPMSFQWRLDGVDVPGATNAILALTDALPPQAGLYSLSVSNRYGVATSEPAFLRVWPIEIQTQPLTQTQYAGGAVSLSVTAGGPGPFRYHWRLFGTNLPGATNATLALSSLQFAQSGPYSVAVSNVWGGVISADAQLTVVPSLITAQPTNTSNFSGGTASFSVAAQGVAPISYQWQRNGIDLPGATSATLLLANVQSAQAGAYTVRITNPYGVVTSWPASLIVSSVVAWGSYKTAFVGVSNIVAIAAGDSHSLALRRDGTVLAEGSNTYGQQTVPPGLTNVQAIACGQYHSLALRADGTVVVWGRNESGQTNVPAGLSGVVAIAGRSSQSFALRTDGTVIGWGSYIRPEHIAAMSNVVAAAASGSWPYGMALRPDGQIVWGAGTAPETVPVDLTNVLAIAGGGFFDVALRTDGTIAAWGRHYEGQTNVPPGLSNVIAIAAGLSHGLALRADRTVVAWGLNASGQTSVPAGLSNVMALAGGGYSGHSLALLGDGAPFLHTANVSRTVLTGTRAQFYASAAGALPLSFQWQFNGAALPGATNAALILDAVSQAATGGYALVVSNAFGVVTSAVAVLTVRPLEFVSTPQSVNTYLGNEVSFSIAANGAGSLSYQWQFNGSNLPGATNTSLLLSHVQLGQSGAYAVVVSNMYGAATSAPAMLEVGLVAAWGDNNYGETNLPSGLSDARAVAAHGWMSAAVKADGGLRVWGTFSPELTNVPVGLNDVKQIALGSDHALALRSNGSLVAWGNPSFSQTTNVPAGVIDVVAIAASYWHSLALRADGTVVAWGQNANSQTSIPIGLSNVVGIACGGGSSLALQADGRVVGWGGNQAGSGTAPWLTNAVAIAAGDGHALALRDEGTVVAWGDNQYGQTNVPPGLNNIVAIAAGPANSLAVRADGALFVWGANATGLVSVPATVSNAVSAAIGPYHSLAALGHGIPFLKASLSDRSVLGGERVYFAVEASGGLPLSYQWRMNGTDLPWATNRVLLLTNVLAEQAGRYSVTVSNTSGEITSAEANLLVIPLRIHSPPANRTQYAGGGTTFSLALEGNGPFTYQWRCYGTNLADATDATLTLTNLQFNQAGPYSVTVSNPWGSVTSADAQLTVVSLIVNSQPQARATLAGSSATFAISVSGLAPLRYQWRFNGADLPGATNASLVIANAQAAQAGAYVVVVTNIHGSVTSQVATLTVKQMSALSYYAPILPANFTNVVAMSAGNGHVLAIRSDRTAGGSGGNAYGQTTIPPGVTNLVAVAAGGNHSLALRSNGLVAAWGFNSYGQATVPAGLSNVVAVAAGGNHSLALRANGTLAAWGYNTYGQTAIPARLSNVVAIAAGNNHSLALRADGSLLAWGHNLYGQTNVPAGLTNLVAITAGANHNLALRANGTVAAWGQNFSGQSNVPPGLSKVIALAAGNSHSLALRSDGTVVGWGNNSYGQVTIPVGTSNVVAIACGSDYSLLLGGSGPSFVVTGLADRVSPALGAVYFHATASGLRPLNYQWQRDGVNLTGATNATLAFSGNVIPGRYRLVVANALGTAASVESLLTVPLAFDLRAGVVLATDGFHLRIVGLSGKFPVLIDATTNLADWLPIHTNPPVVGVLDYVDQSATNLALRFYRVGEQNLAPGPPTE